MTCGNSSAMAFASNLKMRCACQMNLNYEENELHNAVT